MFFSSVRMVCHAGWLLTEVTAGREDMTAVEDVSEITLKQT